MFYQTAEDKNHAMGQLRKVITFLRKQFIELRSTPMSIIIVLSGKKKFVKKKTDSDRPVIGANEINTAVCVKTYGGVNSIIIYRIEDFAKVLIHEVIHFLNRDLHGMPILKSIESDIRREYPSVSRVNIMFNEAFTEAYAQYLYCKCGFTSLDKQRKTSLRNVKKFLLLNNCDTIEDFRRLEDYQEISHPFSYILLSSALLHDDKFISWIENKGNAPGLRLIVKKCIHSPSWKDDISRTKIRKTQKYYFKLTSNH
tara:strand:- start:1250 stop:2014 length:765 start_codon:yes stop_codon:yes gene_type:complete